MKKQASPRIARDGLAGLLGLWMTASAQATPAHPPSPVDDRPGRADAILDDAIAPDEPGCAVAVSSGGRVIHERSRGAANLDHGVPITARTAFDVGSVSKQVTAASIALLVLQGRLSLDTEVRTVLPELPAYASPVRVEHLLFHTSGIPEYLDVMEKNGRSHYQPISDEEILQIVSASGPLEFAPGAEYRYSNSGYMLLALMLRRITGESLGRFAAREFFVPLGMSDSRFYEDAFDVIPNRAVGYDRAADGRWRQVHNFAFAVAGDGQLYSTPADLLKWTRNLDEGAVGGAPFVEIMRRAGVPDGDPASTYGFGLIHERAGTATETIHHGGLSWGFRAALARYPQRNLAIAVTCNTLTVDAGDLGAQLADVWSP